MSSLTGLLLLAFLVATQCFFSALGFAPRMSRTLPSAHGSKLSMMAEITSGVEFNTIAREWRLKWSPEDNKKSLASVQQTLILFTSTLKKVDGVKGVQRIVCGGCHDYKVITSLDAAKFAAWEAKGFAPEEDFLAAVKAINGVSQVETQTYTIEPVF